MKVEVHYCDICYEDQGQSNYRENCKVNACNRCRICGKDLCKIHACELLESFFCESCYTSKEIEEVKDLIAQAKERMEELCKLKSVITK